MVFFLGLLCVAVGFVGIIPLFSDRYPRLQSLDEKITPYKILLGLAALIVGVIRFIVPYHGLNAPLIPLFGDFFPSAAAMLLGVLVSMEFIESLKGVKGSFTEKLKTALHRYQYPLGFAGIFFGILHWFLFRVVFF